MRSRDVGANESQNWSCRDGADLCELGMGEFGILSASDRFSTESDD